MPTGRYFALLVILSFTASPSGWASEEALCKASDFPDIPLIPIREDELIHVQANEANVSKQQVSTFRGDVQVNRGKVQLSADEADVHYLDDTLDARGNVEFIGPGLLITGQSAHAEMKNNQAEFVDAVYFTEERANGKAAKILMLDQYRFQLYGATYTTCNPLDPDWQLSASKVHLDRESHQGTAKHMVMRFKNVPFFYLPYIRFPISEDRLTGLLFPTIGTSSKHGTQVKLPFYWNIAPNYDATITPWYMRKRGTMLQTEFRYLHSINNGQLLAEYINDDKLFGDDRYSVRWEHDGQPGRGWITNIDYNQVSDDEYLQDFGNSLNSTSTTHLNQKGSVQYGSDNWSFSVFAQGYQSLSITSNNPYERLPQLRFNSRIPEIDNQLYYGLDAEWVRFNNDNDGVVVGDRADIKPYLSFPLRTAGTYLIPKLAWRWTQYQLENTSPGSNETPSRSLPTFSLDSGLIFDRDTRMLNTDLQQTLEPRLFYVYTPFRDQSALPIFDTQLRTFNINEPIREDFFDGADRVEDANRFTAMLYTRFLQHTSGNEVFKAGIGQVYYLADQEVTLPGTTLNRGRRSNIIAELDTQPDEHWRFDSSYEWDTEISKMAATNVTLEYRYSDNLKLHGAYHFLRDSLETGEAGLNWRLNPRWRFTGKSLYDLHNKRNQESRIGFRFDSCCWGFSLEYRDRFINEETHPDQSIYLEIEFKGLSSFSTGI